MGKEHAGFTLVELLVSIAIIGILTGILFVGFRSGNKTLALERSVQKAAQDVRRAAGLAFQTQDNTCLAPFFTGYGIRFVRGATSYTIFADCNGNRIYQPADDTGEVVKLEPGVTIKSVSTGINVNILFEPPDLKVWINNNAVISSVNIVFALVDNSSVTRTITVTNKGVVDIQ